MTNQTNARIWVILWPGCNSIIRIFQVSYSRLIGIGLLRLVKWLGKTDFTGEPVPVNYSHLKLSGD